MRVLSNAAAVHQGGDDDVDSQGDSGVSPREDKAGKVTSTSSSLLSLAQWLCKQCCITVLLRPSRKYMLEQNMQQYLGLLHVDPVQVQKMLHTFVPTL